jgi:hypothetical protein
LPEEYADERHFRDQKQRISIIKVIELTTNIW